MSVLSKEQMPYADGTCVAIGATGTVFTSVTFLHLGAFGFSQASRLLLLESLGSDCLASPIYKLVMTWQGCTSMLMAALWT